MILTQRQLKILKLCLESDDYVRTNYLAEILQTSIRTIQRELKSISTILRKFDLRLVTKNKLGIKIIGSSENKKILETELINQVVEYVNKEERRNLLIFELLRTNQIEKLIHFANMFKVSEATISHDLDVIEPWFDQFDLQILRKPGLGVEIKGEEANYRQALKTIVYKSIADNPNYQNTNPYSDETTLTELFKNNEGIMNLLDQEILERVVDVLSTNIHELKLERYTQNSYMGLIIHLTIAIARIKMNEPIEDNKEVEKLVTDQKSFTIAKRIVKLLENEFEIKIPDIELSFISLHLQCGKEVRDTSTETSNELYHLVEKMIEVLNEPYQSIVKDDIMFKNGLISHLKPTIIRLKNNLPIYNPLLEDIKTSYDNVYAEAIKASKPLSEFLNISVSDDEVGYIAMHIGASYERGSVKPVKEEKVLIGIVCASGIGVSALLEARLKKAMSSSIKLKTMSLDEIKNSDCDMYVSTFEINDSHKPVVVVNPLLNKSDVIAIHMEIEKIRETKETKYEIHTHQDEYKILDYLKTASSAAIFIAQNLHFLEVNSKLTKIEIINKSIELFENNQIKRDAIVQAILKREEINDTIYQDFGFGILHAVSECVQEPKYVLVVPKECDTFEDELMNISFLNVTVIPQNCSLEIKELLSALSKSYLDNQVMQTIKKKNRSLIIAQLEKVMYQAIQEKVEDYEDNEE